MTKNNDKNKTKTEEQLKQAQNQARTRHRAVSELRDQLKYATNEKSHTEKLLEIETKKRIQLELENREMKAEITSLLKQLGNNNSNSNTKGGGNVNTIKTTPGGLTSDDDDIAPEDDLLWVTMKIIQQHMMGILKLHLAKTLMKMNNLCYFKHKYIITIITIITMIMTLIMHFLPMINRMIKIVKNIVY